MAEKCVYVADNEKKDFIAPVHLGIHAVRIKRPRGIHPDYDGSDVVKAEKQVFSLAELPEVLNEF